MIKNNELQAQSFKITGEILETYKSYNTYFGVDNITIINGRFLLEIKLLPGSKIEDIKKNAKNVQMTLKLPVFQVHQDGLYFYIVAAYEEKTSNELLSILKKPNFSDSIVGFRLPYVVGLNYMGEPFSIDIAKMPNLIKGGSSNSGKTVGLKALLISLLSCCDPKKLKICVLDNGAADLMIFDDICTVIDDTDDGVKAILGLKETMSKRIKLRRENADEFFSLPYIVTVIDELPALISECYAKNQLTEALRGLLQRCRHANMSVILTAQNPTKENLKLDLGSVACRISYRTAKTIQSCTILDEGGAEDLMNQGDMLFLSPYHNGIHQIRGSYISPQQVATVLDELYKKYGEQAFAVDDEDLEYEHYILSEKNHLPEVPATPTKAQIDDILFSKVIIWTLGCETVSANSISKAFKMKWDRGNTFLNRLHQFRIVDDFNGGSRKVVPVSIDDLEGEVVSLLERYDYTEDDIEEAFNNRK